MAEVEQRDDAAEEDRARKDAEAGEKLDKLLTHLDSLHKRLDSLESEEERKDAERDEEEEERKDAEMDIDDEIDEPKRVAADRAKKDEEEDERKDRARKDSAAIMDRIARVESMLPRQVTDAEYAAMADAQAGADKVYAAFGDSAPRPLQGEDLINYRRRLATGLKRHSGAWNGIDLGKLPGEALEIAVGQIYSDAMTAARNPSDVPEGQLRAILSTDETGRRHTSFVGQPRSWMRDFSPSQRFLTGINTKQGA